MSPMIRILFTHSGSRNGQTNASPTRPPRRRCGSPAREAADTPPCSKATWQAVEVEEAVVAAADLPAPPARRPQKVRHSTEQCSCDHDALNLVRALIDLRNLGVAHHSLDRVVPG